ncbi:barstar family protein [Oceanobacillus luteolus]|uniref:barstar family protein n=1 Tax=Oceanobacillus luteolus TaxID=1274358 RepID=UPI00203B6D4A|nr:barstar family protein [Oceanobacillus luteolus]MCM3740960.1 barstar family protein [Oceanobacillus luteolus]
MKYITLNGKEMLTKEDVHPYLKDKLSIKEYYGNNLDALWDVLSTYNKVLQIELLHHDDLLENLGEYAQAIVQLFHDATEENPNIKFIIR